LGRQWDSFCDGGAIDHFAAGPPQGEIAPLGGSDPRSGGAWGLTFSLGLELTPADWSGLSLAVGLALAEALHPEIQIKWPNDLWYQGRKLAGILIETATVGNQRYAVIGVGINIGARSSEGLRTPPAWLQELQPQCTPGGVLACVLRPLVLRIQECCAQGFGGLREAYHARDFFYGKDVVCTDGLVGQARGVDAKGALLVLSTQGLQKISSAEVSVRTQV
jgi:BirA family biotin operon repressor/biotin-[acetyl-CoA-carboxylase] ligase